MSNIDIFIRTTTGTRRPFASLNSATEIREMRDLLVEIGVYTAEAGLVNEVDMQAVIDELGVGIEYIVQTE